MKLWLLKTLLDKDSCYRYKHFDYYHGFIIRAKNERTARELADEWFKSSCDKDKADLNVWLDEHLSICKELCLTGQEAIITTLYIP